MPIFDIQIPSGKIISIESDNPPTQKEIDEATMIVEGQQVDPLRASLGEEQVPLAPTRLDRELTEREKKNLRVLRQIATQAPAAAAAFATGGISIPAQAGIQGLLTAGGTLLEKAITPEEQKVTGESPLKEAGITGLTAAGLEAALPIAGKVLSKTARQAAKLIKKGPEQILKRSTQIEKQAVDKIIDNPELFTAQKNENLADDIFEDLKKVKQVASDEYEASLDALPESFKKAKYKNLNRGLKEAVGSKSLKDLSKKYESIQKDLLEDIDENLLENVIEGDRLTLKEFIILNRSLGNIERMTPSSRLQPDVINTFSKIKTTIKNNMAATEKIKDINKRYAEKIQPVKNIEKKLTSYDAQGNQIIEDSKVITLIDDAKKILRDKRTKKQTQFKDLNQIGKILGEKNKYSNILEDEAVKDLVQEGMAKSKLSLSELGILGSLGLGISPVITAAMGPTLYGLRLSGATEKLIETAAKLRRPVKEQIKPSVISQIGQAISTGRKVTSPVISRQLGGYLTPETTEEIKQERRIK